MSDQKHILLLHGAMRTKEDFKMLAELLEDQFSVHAINFEGHGNRATTDQPFRIAHFVENIIDYLGKEGIEKTDIFGYSMGGYVALALAKQHPERAGKIATLGSVLQWNEEKAKAELRYLNPDKMMEKVPHFVDQLDQQHQCGWKTMVSQTRKMLQYLGKHPNLKASDWGNIGNHVRLCVGDRDTSAGLESTVEVYQQMKNAELSVLPNTPHPIEKVDIELLAELCLVYFK